MQYTSREYTLVIADVRRKKMNIDNPIILMVTLLGGFAVSLLVAVLAMLPWLKRMPKRWALMLAGLIPIAVLTGMLLADLLVIGRQPKVFAAMSPIVIALALPCVTLLASCRKSTTETKKRVAGICLSLILILAVLWSVLILWEMADRNFLGAGC